jgi:hypothetical protein
MSTMTTCSVIRRRRLSRRPWRSRVAFANGQGAGLGRNDSAPGFSPTCEDTGLGWDDSGENLGSGLPEAAPTRDSPAIPAGVDSEAAERAVVI